MAVDTNSLAYLIDPFWQGEGINGKPLVAGYMCVYVAGTNTKYITYQNFDGTRNPFKIPLGSDGRAVILVEAQYKYDCYLYDSFGNLACSRLNVAPAVGGDVSVSGLTEVYHDESLSGDGTPYAPLAVVSAGKVYSGIEPIVVNNDEDKISAQMATFGVESPLYLSEDSTTATVVSINMSTMEAALTGKANTTALNEIRDNMLSATAIGGVNSIITGYNGSAFSAGSTYSGIAPITVDNENKTISVSSKELEAQAPLQITETDSAYVLSLTGGVDNPRVRVVEYGVDGWSDVVSAMEAVSSGKYDYVVMKYSSNGTELYAPMTKYVSGDYAQFVCPANAADESFGYGQRKVTDIFTVNSGNGWSDVRSKPFQGRLIGRGDVSVTVAGEDYVISANGIDASASEAIDLVTANSGDWNSTYNTVSDNSASWGQSGKTYTGISPVIVDNTADTIAVSAKPISVQTPLTFSETENSFVFGITGTDKWDSTYDTVSANSGSWGGIEPSASEAIDAVTANSGTWNTVTNKLDTTAFSTVSGNFITAHQALPESANWDSTHITVQANSGSWNETYSAVSSNSADWNTVIDVSAGRGMVFNQVNNVVYIEVDMKTGSI